MKYDVNLCMNANLSYVRDKFRFFNDQIFDGKLPDLPIKISTARTRLGMFCYPVADCGSKRIKSSRRPEDCCLRISNRIDMQPDQIDDTIIHEMIHYYIWYFDIEDTSAHGPAFMRIMHDVNRRFGRNITVSIRMSEQMHASDSTRNHHYLLMSVWEDGRRGLTPVPRTRIFEMHRIFSSLDGLSDMKWYYTTDPFFNRFPKFIRPKLIKMTPDIQEHLLKAIPCSNNGSTFKIIGQTDLFK